MAWKSRDEDDREGGLLERKWEFEADNVEVAIRQKHNQWRPPATTDKDDWKNQADGESR